MSQSLEKLINQAWEIRSDLANHANFECYKKAIESTLQKLDIGAYRIASQNDTAGWDIHEWLKKAVLLSFKLFSMQTMGNAPAGSVWFDKLPMKFDGWDAAAFTKANIRAVPGSIVRHSAYIAPNVILMPCFVNIGAYIDSGTLIDAWSTIGSCAQIGKNVHISGGVGIGGVLEPLQANPVIIEDDCFIGARSEIAEGMIIEKGAVISMGVFLGASTKIINRDTGEIHYGRVPAYNVVIPGTLPGKTLPDGSPGPNLACAVIVKQVDARTRSKTSINDLLRN